MFDSKVTEFFSRFGNHKNMVLSTCLDNKVHARMMSIVCFQNKFYFQTDKTFRKCKDISDNSNVSLCIDNIQIEGVCTAVGKPIENKAFCEIFSTSFPKAYELYTNLENEILYEIEPAYIECWLYENSKPYIEIYDMSNREYYKKQYEVKM